METKREAKERYGVLTFFSLVFLQYLLVFFFFFFSFFLHSVLADVGVNNFTVISGFNVGVSEPVIVNISVTPESVNLVPNSSVIVNCSVIIENYEGDFDIISVDGEFYDSVNSFYGDVDNKNFHYTNSSCVIDKGYGDSYSAMSICVFDVEYNSNPGLWECTVNVSNSYFSVQDYNITTLEPLLGLGLPDSINYGQVNATMVSEEVILNVTNYGNVVFNLTLEGYAQNRGDGYAMNCSLGSYGFIDVEYEKYNLSGPTPGYLDFTNFSDFYVDLTSDSVVRDFKLNYRQDEDLSVAVNQTFWRIYVPTGVAGSCTGNIVFGASTAPGV